MCRQDVLTCLKVLNQSGIEPVRFMLLKVSSCNFNEEHTDIYVNILTFSEGVCCMYMAMSMEVTSNLGT